MNNKRTKSSNTFVERNNQEALHLRNKSSIGALNELMKDVALVKHRKTLDEVAKAMTRALESDQKWYAKCQELQTELSANERKLQIALQLSEEDKHVIETLNKELQDALNVIEGMNQKNYKGFRNECADKGDMDVGEKEGKADKMLEEIAGDRYTLLEEIEKGKLQVFELEEELANKEKLIEDLTINLSLKAKQLEDIMDENAKLNIELYENKTLNDKEYCRNKTMSDKIIQSDMYTESSQMLDGQITLKQKLEDIQKRDQITLKKKLDDINKKEEINLQKLKHFIKKNKMLNRQLQMIKTQNNLMKLQIAEQTRMLDLLSSQCCKMEENNKKQTFAISALKSVRDKYSHIIGVLEHKVHEMKKK